MKTKILYLTLICCSVVAAGCSTNFSDIFDNDNPDTFKPVDGIGAETGDTLMLELMETPGFNFLARDVIATVGLSNGDGAIIVNRSELLKDVVLEDRTCSWPEIDFSQTSLIIGRFNGSDSGFYLANQRVVQEAGQTKLYVEIRRRQYARLYPSTTYFAALYPKLPDGSIEFIRWNNY